ncbi:MAG: hypothetical protein HZA93_23560 [Verrucomicrobia bacterium]|nr:hypothetical protein [Verrucomicrobiota bacterium]
MNQETVTYLTSIIIGAILASLATHYWRERRQSGVLACWAVAAWVLTVADVLFAARPLLPHALGRLLPTLCVTIGQAVLLLGAQRTVGMAPRWRWLGAVVAVHAAGLVGFLFVESPSNFRMVFNGLVWGSLSVASALCLRRGAGYFWQSMFSPATAFLAHAVFHAVRIGLALVFAAYGWKTASASLQVLGDLEVSFFMVALFVGLLIAHLKLRHEELMRAQVEVETLTGLLPICAWCKKVRDDDGYWRQVEEYFARHSRLKFTHGVCVDCMDKLKEEPEPAPRR